MIKRSERADLPRDNSRTSDPNDIAIADVSSVSKLKHDLGVFHWYVAGSMLLFLMVVVCSLLWNIYAQRESMETLAKREARAAFNRDEAFRQFIASRGGVYVPLDERTPSNPYLKHPERDVVTTTGRELTLMNGAYFFHKVMAEFGESTDVNWRLTSLQPVNPVNKPDGWEERALRAFQRGAKEMVSFDSIEGELHVRSLAPLVTKEACLKCHQHQGYRVGEIRGAMGVSLPMGPYLEQQTTTIRHLAWTHAACLLLGLGGLFAGSKRYRKRIAASVEMEQELEDRRLHLGEMVRARTVELRKEVREHELAEEELRKSREHLQLAISSAQIAIYDWNLQENQVVWSEGAEETLGFTAGSFGSDFDGYMKWVHPEDVQPMNQRVSSTIEEGRVEYRSEYRVIRPDGDVRWISSPGEFHYGPSGAPERVSGIMIDITERKQTEDELDRIFELSPDLIGVADANSGYFMRVNPAWEDILGYSTDEFLSRPFMDFIHPDDRDATRQEVDDQLSRKPVFSFVNRYRSKDGSYRAIEWHATPAQADGVVYATGRDITERRRMQDALRESEEKYRALFENTPITTIVVNSEGRIQNYNLAEEDSTTREPRIGDVMYRDYAAKHELDMHEQLMDAIGTGETKEFLDLKYGERFLRVRFAPFAGGAIISSIDSTPVRDLEARLNQAQKMEAIGTLAGGISHDFNNILGIILANTELAINDVPDWNPATECLKEIRTATLRGRDITRQILSFSRHRLFDAKPMMMTPVVEEALQLIRATTPTSVEMRKDLDAEQDVIIGDPVQISQVLLNLCANAHHAMPHGGTLDIGLSNVTIDKAAQKKDPALPLGNCVRLTVRDTGKGIDPGNLERIFDPYYTTKSVGEGTGMGLSVVRGIAANCGGHITVESEVGKGTTLHVYLPLADKVLLQEAENSQDIPTGSERIIFVDDEKALVRSWHGTLVSLGYDVIPCNSPIEALEAFSEEPEDIDLVITDMTMPEMTGEVLTRELRRVRPDIPIIICTGHSESIAVESTKTLGVAGYALKPIEKRDIAFKIRKALDGSVGSGPPDDSRQ